MPKITGPLLSITASGSIAKRITFSKKRTGQQVRFQRAQKDYSNTARAKARLNYQNAVSAWNELNPFERNTWNALALGKKYTGYNLFVKTYLLKPPGVLGYLLLQDGGYLLQQNGDKIIK